METNDFKGTDVIEHEILVGDAQPIRRRPYRTPYALRGEIKAQIEDMLRKGVIRESNSPWSAPAILVPKRSPDGNLKFRFCVDFRALNSVTKFDPYPLPVFEETVSSLFGSKYFSVLDCYSGFWQVSIKEDHKERMGFSVPFGHYEFNRLPFGLLNSPANFHISALTTVTATFCLRKHTEVVALRAASRFFLQMWQFTVNRL